MVAGRRAVNGLYVALSLALVPNILFAEGAVVAGRVGQLGLAQEDHKVVVVLALHHA